MQTVFRNRKCVGTRSLKHQATRVLSTERSRQRSVGNRHDVGCFRATRVEELYGPEFAWGSEGAAVARLPLRVWRSGASRRVQSADGAPAALRLQTPMTANTRGYTTRTTPRQLQALAAPRALMSRSRAVQKNALALGKTLRCLWRPGGSGSVCRRFTRERC